MACVLGVFGYNFRPPYTDHVCHSYLRFVQWVKVSGLIPYSKVGRLATHWGQQRFFGGTFFTMRCASSRKYRGFIAKGYGGVCVGQLGVGKGIQGTL